MAASGAGAGFQSTWSATGAARSRAFGGSGVRVALAASIGSAAAFGAERNGGAGSGWAGSGGGIGAGAGTGGATATAGATGVASTAWSTAAAAFSSSSSGTSRSSSASTSSGSSAGGCDGRSRGEGGRGGREGTGRLGRGGEEWLADGFGGTGIAGAGRVGALRGGGRGGAGAFEKDGFGSDAGERDTGTGGRDGERERAAASLGLECNPEGVGGRGSDDGRGAIEAEGRGGTALARGALSASRAGAACVGREGGAGGPEARGLEPVSATAALEFGFGLALGLDVALGVEGIEGLGALVGFESASDAGLSGAGSRAAAAVGSALGSVCTAATRCDAEGRFCPRCFRFGPLFGVLLLSAITSVFSDLTTSPANWLPRKAPKGQARPQRSGRFHSVGHTAQSNSTRWAGAQGSWYHRAAHA